METLLLQPTPLSTGKSPLFGLELPRLIDDHHVHRIKVSRDGIEYVLIHELAYLKHHDHGQDFCKLIENTLPNWRTHKGVLDNMVEALHSD